MEIQQPLLITATAPIRICDLGGWTDTWFAEYGRIFNIAVSPKVEVQIEARLNDGNKPPVTIHAENFGDVYVPELINGRWQKHPLLEATLVRMGVPQGLSLTIYIYSDAPAGASTGTSAAVTVALIGALDGLTRGQLSPHEMAYLAQSIETEMLGQQCGIQDQLAAAYGGINDIEMFRYPYASVSPVRLPESVWHELEQRLCLIYLGKPHNSSQVHEMVIQELEDLGASAKKLEPLRETAVAAKNALLAHDFAAFGQAMNRNTAAQAHLHPELVSHDAEWVIAIAQRHGAIGWKVNGAGGDGGSITLLASGHSFRKREMIRAIEAEMPHCKQIPISLSQEGVRVWKRPL